MAGYAVSNSDNAPRPSDTFAGRVNSVLAKNLASNPNLVIGGQLVKYGYAGLTTGLYKQYPDRFITYSVSEELMNSSALGLALAGKTVVMCHVRLDFLLCGMNALCNTIPVFWKKGHRLPIVVIAQEGRGIGTGQGAEHSKDFTFVFQRWEGWNVCVPQTPTEAAEMLDASLNGSKPTMYVLHRRLFNAKEGTRIVIPQEVKLCGASKRHNEEFYRDR